MTRIFYQPGLGLLFWSLCIAIAALSAVAFFADRVQQALERKGAATLAADLVVQQGTLIPPEWIEKARQHDLQVSQIINFPSVIFTKGKPRLVQAKAVDAAYPLRGDLVVQPDTPVKSGQAIAAQAFFDALDVQPGEIQIPFGKLQLDLSAVLLEEPDPGASLFQLAPRLLVSWEDAQNSGLLGPASRVRYRLLVAGDLDDIQAYREWIKERLPANAELLDIDSGRPQLASAVQRAQRFLSLAALCASLLAGVGILLTIRHFVQGLFDQAAILRTLGMRRRQILWRYIQPLLMVTFAGAIAGIMLGYLVQYGFSLLAIHWFDIDLPAAGWQPIPVALLHAVILVAGFALPTLLSIQQVSPLRVLRRDLKPVGLSQGLVFFVSAIAFYALIQWQVGDDKLAMGMGASLLVMILVFALSVCLLLKGLGWLRRRTSGAWSGLSALTRDPGLTLVQLTGYGLAITLLLMLALVRVDLLQAWEDQQPEHAPNHFLLNIQLNEVEDIQKLFGKYGIQDSGLYPTMRARLLSINGQVVDPENYSTPRGKELVTREYNLGFGDTQQKDNRLLSGDWWRAGEDGFAVEKRTAEHLKLQIGDLLQFDVAGQNLQAPVSNIRSVAWDSFNVNFFVQGSASLLRDLPYAVITSVHIPKTDQATFLKELVQTFPAVSAINLQPLLDKVDEVIAQGTLAIEGVFIFTLIAAMLVSIAAIQISREQRLREIALLRVLGASHRWVLVSVISEFVLLGGLAGLLASALANGLGILLAGLLFDLNTGFNPLLWLIGISGGLLAVGLVGYLASRPILRVAPMQLLR